jgi:hypothetical protein
LNCNTWIAINFENIFYAPSLCPKCESAEGFAYVGCKSRQGIDIVIPATLAMPNFSDCKLRPVDIPLPIIQCLECDEMFNVVPDFITAGTTLTLAAQVLVAVCYHAEEKDGWRKLHQVLCDLSDGIAHTTLYRGYHSFGKNLIGMKDKISMIIEKTMSSESIDEIPKKARKTHTKEHEAKIIRILLILWLSLYEGWHTFWKNYWRLIEVLTVKTGYTESFQKHSPHKPSNTS